VGGEGGTAGRLGGGSPVRPWASPGGAFRYDRTYDPSKARWTLDASWKTGATAGAVVIENLNFDAARTEGRELAGNRPSRGRRGKRFHRHISPSHFTVISRCHI